MNKRGVSEIIGYVLLIAIVVVISIFVYEWLKTYVPQQSLTCPDGVSVAVNTVIYNCTSNTLNFTLLNDGTFSVGGYFIHASNDTTGQQIPSINLITYFIGTTTSAFPYPAYNSIAFDISLGVNGLSPGQGKRINVNAYNLSLSPSIAVGTLNEIEITPTRYVEFNGKSRFTSCGNAKIDIPITCVY